MKNYFLLIKAVFASSVTARKNRKNQLTKGSRIPQLLCALLITVVFSVNFYFNIVQYASLSLSVNEISNYFIPAISFSILYSFFFSLTLSFNVFFLSNNEAFLSLPISGNRLLSARFFLHFFNSFCYGSALILVELLMIPIIFNLGAIAILYSVIIGILITLGICFASFILGCVLFYLFNLKNNSVLYTVLSIIFSLLGAFALASISSFAPSIDVYSSINDAILKLQNDLNNFYNVTRFCNFLGYLPARGVMLENVNDYLSLIYLILICLALFGLTFLFSRYLYLKTISQNKGKKKKKIADESFLSKKFNLLNKRTFFIYLKRELNLLKSHPSLLISSLISTVTIAISLIITGIFTAKSFTQAGNDFQQQNLFFLIVHILVLESIFNPLIGFSALSLEGRNFLALKAMPLKKNQFLLAKALPSLTLSLFLSLISSTVFSISYQLSAIYIIALFLSTISSSLINTLFSLLYGIIFARFSYDNSLELLNRGIGPLLSSLTTILSPIIFISLDLIFYYFTTDLMWVSMLLGSFIYFIGAIPLFILIKKRFNKLLISDLNIL